MYSRRRLVALLIALLGLALIGGFAGPAAAGSAGATAASAAPDLPADAGALQTDDDDESERVPHEHPDDAEGQGDDGAVAEWLIGELEGGLEESAIEISEGQYEAGRQALGEDYQQRLSQYVDVAGDTNWQTEDESDPRTRDEVAAEEFQAVHETQTELADVLVEYEETLAEYERARDRGDEERALELARDLVSLADRVEALGGELDARYARIEAVVERDLSDATVAIDERERATREETDRIAEDAFRETSLTVEVRDATVSASNPLRVAGRLLDEDGDPIRNATIAVTDPVAAAPAGAAGSSEPVGSGSTTTVRTDADGTFELAHRPNFVSLDVEHLTVQYRPERLSPHRAASEDVSVDVEQVDGEVRVANDPTTVRYGDEIDVGVVASAAGEPVAGVPFELTVGGAHATGVTDENGAVRLSTPVPRDASPEDASVSIDVAVDGWSVAFEPYESAVDVEVTPTAISADTHRASDGSGVEVVGQLTTADGTPVAGAPVEITAESGTVTEVGGSGDENESSTDESDDGPVEARTDEDGRYAVTIDASDAGDGVVASYAEPDSNLEDAEASAALPSGGGAGASGALAALPDVLSRPTVVAPLLGALLLVGGVVAWRRSDPSIDGDGREPPADGGEAEETDPVPESYDSPDLLEAAGESLSDAPAKATVLAYGAGREALDAEVEATSDATHWEFYEACRRDGLDEETVEALRILTERYEAAAYAPGEVDSQTARDALAAAKHVR